MVAINMGLCARYFGLLLLLLLSMLMILSSFLVNFPVNVKSFVGAMFDFNADVHEVPLIGAATAGAVTVAIVFIDVDGNDMPMLFVNKCCCCCCWSFIESLVLAANRLIELLERLSGSSSVDGPGTGTYRSIVVGGSGEECFCFLFFLSFLCFLCFFFTTSLFILSLIG